MKKNPLVVVFLLSLSAAFGQMTDTLNRDVAPKGGIAAVGLVYYKIEFTPEEVAYLRDNEAEMIFKVSEEGKATLEKVNNIGLPSIVDSMMRVNDRLPEFYPEVVDGKPQPSLYFMKIRWPEYETVERTFPRSTSPPYPSPYEEEFSHYRFIGRKLDEFEYINYRGPRYDMLFGGVANTVGGSAIDYIYSGGGMKFDMMFYGEKGWGGGIVMTFHGNRARKEYPITTQFPQNKSRTTGFVGLAIGRLLADRPGGQFSVQFEACYSMQNIVTVDPQVNNRPVQTQGFSPGFVINYAKNLGRGKMSIYYLSPTAIRHFLNLHLAIRPMMLDMPQASGIMYEAGISWRMGMRHVEDMKLKE